MLSYIKIAWRNLWRNKRRTILTICSVFLAIFLALITRSMQTGTYSQMIRSSVKLSTGYIQIHHKGYWDDKSINNTFLHSQEVFNKVSSQNSVTKVIPKLESFALCSSGEHTKGVAVIGSDLEKENSLIKLSDKIVEGKYLTKNESGVMIGKKLAQFLNVSIGDTLVLLGQGYHGVTAAGQFNITGIFDYPIPQFNNQIVLMNLKDCQELYASYDMLTSYTIMINDGNQLEEVKEELINFTDNNYEVMTWREMNPELVQVIQGDNAGGIFMLAILYMVVGFGVFGTIMMMTMERKKEFAIMIALGLQKLKLAKIIFWESIFIGLIGLTIGILFSLPIVFYFNANPIEITGAAAESFNMMGIEPLIPFSTDIGLFISQTITVFIILIIAMLYPISFIQKMNILKGIRD